MAETLTDLRPPITPKRYKIEDLTKSEEMYRFGKQGVRRMVYKVTANIAGVKFVRQKYDRYARILQRDILQPPCANSEKLPDVICTCGCAAFQVSFSNCILDITCIGCGARERI